MLSDFKVLLPLQIRLVQHRVSGLLVSHAQKKQLPEEGDKGEEAAANELISQYSAGCCSGLNELQKRILGISFSLVLLT